MAREKEAVKEEKKPKKEEKKPREGKKEKEKKHKSNKWKLYEISGEKAKKKNKSCPKCGSGVFLAQHKDRASCGNCGYTEFRTSKGD
jgi:small subunit ribosomal protein S27Ae